MSGRGGPKGAHAVWALETNCVFTIFQPRHLPLQVSIAALRGPPGWSGPCWGCAPGAGLHSAEEEAELELDEELEETAAGASATGVRDNPLEPPARFAGPAELLATPATNPAPKDWPLDAASPSANACNLYSASHASFAEHLSQRLLNSAIAVGAWRISCALWLPSTHANINLKIYIYIYTQSES